MATSSSSDDEELQTLRERALATILTPFNIATSRTAFKAYLGTLLFLAASLVLIALSTTAYLLFYNSYVPQIGLEEVIHLQYGNAPHPYAITALEDGALSSQQPYDISLELHLPRTPNNLAAGNFMLDLSLLSRPSSSTSAPALNAFLPNASTILAHSRRPAILSYQSPILSIANKMISLPWHTLGFRDLDAEKLSISMFERLSFARGWRNVPAVARFELQSDQALQVYSAKIVFKARFEGLRYILYNYRVISFLVFTTSFYTIALTSTSLAWLVLSSIFGTGNKTIKQEEAETKRIKTEDHTEGHSSNGTTKKEPRREHSAASDESGLSMSNLSDTGTTFPTLGRQMPLRFPVHRPGDTSRPTPSTGVGIKREPDEERRLESTAIEPLSAAGATADDEDEGEESEPARGRDPGDRDSGIGTSMESEGARAVQRRRSRRSGSAPDDPLI